MEEHHRETVDAIQSMHSNFAADLALLKSQVDNLASGSRDTQDKDERDRKMIEKTLEESMMRLMT